ncbi:MULTISPECIES: DedA family protein [Kocuria]|jgi:membrane protein DedA with SNARE-associated domain|uniref:DedA family protein n=1 Tax=Kocuria TaxID=57493 RepID=UPI00203B2BC6|nr:MULTISPECIES: DedA family protein [Kocuria]MCM3689298.1 DedA family protein [Kocuria rosea]HST72423.1 DedA family protein [Kocuria rosea]
MSSLSTALPTVLDAAAEPAGESLGGIADWAVGVMETIGAPGAGLLVALENLFPPLPSEVILPLAGFTASQGSFTVGGAIFWTTLGAVVGAIALYWIGAALGRRRLRAIVDRMPLVDLHDLDRTEEWFDRHGKAAVFFGRMIPVFRSLISIPAGIERMSFGAFVLLSTAGSLIWNTVFVLAGYYLGENWHVAEQYAGVFSRIVVVLVAAFLLWWVVKRVLRNRRGLTDAARRERGEL